jgi:tetratricopeptide (TPR) repeat protein
VPINAARALITGHFAEMPSMKAPKLARRKNLYRLLAAAAVALPSMAFGQGMIDAGRSNDASNRVGSGGRNAAGLGWNTYSNYIVNNGNQVVTGNVSNGREFHGNVGYSDPTAFRGVTAGSISDNFVKNSSGVPRAYSPPPVPNTSVPFYGASQTVAPPPGFQLNPSRTGYVPAPATTGQRGVQDQRLGIVDLNQPINPTTLSGDLILRGSLTPDQAAKQAGILTGSNLYGVREWNPQDPADRVFLENLMSRQNTLNHPQLDPRDVQRMRDELQKALEGERPQQQPGQKGQGTQQERSSDSFSLNPPVGRSFDAPNDPAVASKPLSAQVQSQPLDAAGVGTDQGMRFNLLSSGAARRTSTQYAELNKRLEQYYTDRRIAGDEAIRKFNAELRAKNAADAAAGNKKPNPNDVTAGKVNPVAPGTPTEDATKPKVKKPAPMKVTNLSQGVKAEGIGKLLRTAEAQMKEGKFATALEQYDAAEIVAPNDPMIWLGRANAELGAGFFQRADQHVRQALTTDQALLMAQYDLTGMIGEDRLAKIVQDLKETANKDSKPMAPFLLAYIAYNTGHERQALGYLDLAEKRAPEQAAFYKMLREHWALPDAGAKPGADEGKAPKPQTSTPELPKPELNK